MLNRTVLIRTYPRGLKSYEINLDTPPARTDAGHMPVRFLLYVAMTGLAHQMISVVQAHGTNHGGASVTLDVLIISVAMLVLALATLVIRFGSAKFPAVRDTLDDKSTTQT